MKITKSMKGIVLMSCPLQPRSRPFVSLLARTLIRKYGLFCSLIFEGVLIWTAKTGRRAKHSITYKLQKTNLRLRLKLTHKIVFVWLIVLRDYWNRVKCKLSFSCHQNMHMQITADSSAEGSPFERKQTNSFLLLTSSIGSLCWCGKKGDLLS